MISSLTTRNCGRVALHEIKNHRATRSIRSRIADGLLANDRVKVRLSILQAAARHARDPSEVHFNLANECRTLGIDHLAMETLINRASEAGDKQIVAPGLGALRAAIWLTVGPGVPDSAAGALGHSRVDDAQ
jgi:hypothetical protein